MQRITTAIVLFGALVLGACTSGRPEQGPDATARLLAAVAGGDVAGVRDAIADGADLERRDEDGRTPLVAATKADRIEVARALLDAGADPDAKDDLQDSAFLYAGAEGLDEILAMTLDHGARRAQHQPLRRHGTDPGERARPRRDGPHADRGRRPDRPRQRPGLDRPARGDRAGQRRQDHVTVVRLLLEAGADATIPDRNGTLPRQLAADAGHTAIVAELDRHR